MKKLILSSLLAVFLSALSFSLENRYLDIQFYNVETVQIVDYLEYKDFLNQVYQESVLNEDIAGWDFWSLKTGPNNETFHYATITYFNDPVKMMNGVSFDKLVQNAKKAFPDMKEEA